jgi:hypothetical protein
MSHLDEEEPCAFCEGRAAAHRGEQAGANPYPPVNAPAKSREEYESDHWLWSSGHIVGSKEPGGRPWYADPVPTSSE